MNATVNTPMPRLASVDPTDPLKIRAKWKSGLRAGTTEIVDLAPLILSLKFYRALRNDPKLFGTLHIARAGSAIAWGEGDEIDMPATSIERLAQESMTAEKFRAFLTENGMTHAQAAAEFGYSRRRIEDFLAGTAPIPRVLVLASFGYLARKAKAAEPVEG
jgi:hypothetical protein